MSDPTDELARCAQLYADDRNITIVDAPARGSQGTIYLTDRQSILKVFARDRQPHFAKERDVYVRLQSRNVSQVSRFAIPELVDFDDELLVVEMTTVEPPFALDFASAYLDQQPPYTPEQIAEWESNCEELFGEDWSEVCVVIYALRRLGIYLIDVHPGNICLRYDDS